MTFPPEVWAGVLRLMKAELPDYAYEAWLVPLQPKLDGEVLRVQCPSAFHRDHVRKRLLPRLCECAREQLGQPVAVELCVTSDTESAPLTPALEPSTLPAQPRAAQPKAAQTRASRPAAASVHQRSDAALRTRGEERPRPAFQPPTFENFVVGPCNALAKEASFAIAREQISLRQLFIAAPSGLGKTHLSRATASEARRAGAPEVLYASAESFTNDFMSSVRGHQMARFKQRYRKSRQLLVVEDVQFLAGKAQTQLEFFYTVRHVLDAGGRVLLTGDRLPKDMTRLDSQVRAQLSTGFVAQLEPPDAEVRRGILRYKAAAGGIHLPEDCLDLLVETVRGSIRDLEGALIQLVTTASLLKQPIDLRLTEVALETRADRSPRAIRSSDIDSVVRVVASSFKTNAGALASRSRRRDVMLPRQLAMYLCSRYTDATQAEIGRAFGRSHTSVKNAISRIERDITERAPLRYKIEALVDRLNQPNQPNQLDADSK
jgi:chromosomal replication initiator protein